MPEAKDHRQDRKSGKREFTDDELCRLLYPTQPCDRLLQEFMLIAALSGMRINEIANIKVQDVALKDRTVLIPTAKTKAGVRRVPIHSLVLDIFTRRVKGQPSPSRGRGLLRKPSQSLFKSGQQLIVAPSCV
jgi:integrase